jgi:hypothetical protein
MNHLRKNIFLTMTDYNLGFITFTLTLIKYKNGTSFN